MLLVFVCCGCDPKSGRFTVIAHTTYYIQQTFLPYDRIRQYANETAAMFRIAGRERVPLQYSERFSWFLLF